ncbi:MAG TPA: 5'-3' exonuclease H3TH domain-containing protein [Verrucomicrobiae bacterium]|nr:5'-3' exonuclease H3TH domain-containing protein [Verrucomicrobiae bacterium]
MRKHRLLVVDGHAYAYRAFYAIRNLRSPSGKAVNGIYGFVKMLAKLRAGLQPTHVVVVWDGGMDCDRLAALPEYKAHRPEMPAELAEQIDGMMEFLSAAGVPSVCVEGVEADDWIGCVAREAEKAGWEVVIASADKDFLQLVTLESGGAGTGTGLEGRAGRGWIGLLNPNDKSERIWGVAEVRSKTGVEPSQVLDWLSLLGDAVDGIPGVPGVGAKTAAGLLNLFGSVDGIYARLPEVKSERVREGLRMAEKDVRRNQSLVALKRVAGFEFVPENLVVKPMSVARLKELYTDWGFRGMLAELQAPQERQQSLI